MFLHTSCESSLFRGHKICFGLTHRFGGVSQGAFATLNLSFHIGDDKKSVEHNHKQVRQRFYNTFGITQELHTPLYYLHQTHSTQSLLLDEALESQHKLPNLPQNPGYLGKGDVIITHLPYRICLVVVADCNPILLYDSKNAAMALIHAGRRGVFNGIVAKVFEKMHMLYGTQAKDCLLYIGASIRSCCYEVGEEVREEFVKLGFGAEGMKGNKLDLIYCLQEQCKALGLEQMEISPYCSCCDERLYSYRREKHTGRFGLLAMLL